MHPKIDFIHIGYHKTASTYLQSKYFPSLDGILQLNDRDLDAWFYEHFINTNPHSYDKDRFLKSFCSLTSNFMLNDTSIKFISDENLSGGIYHGLDSLTLMHRLYKTFGKTKILIVIRNQIDWLLSAYSNYVIHGGTKSFQRWLISDETNWGAILKKIHYSDLVKSYIDLYGQDNVHVLCYERLWDNTYGVPNFLNTFGLGVKCNYVDLRANVQAGRSLSANKFLRGANMIGLNKFPKRQKLFALFRPTNKDREYVIATLGSEIDSFSQDNRFLQDLIQQDLPEVYL